MLLNSWISTGPAHSVGCHRPVVSTEFAGPVDSGRNTHIFWSPAHTLTHTATPPANFVTMTTTNQTTPKKYKRSRTSFSGSKRGNTKASRKAAKAAAEPKTPSPSANTSKKRPHGQKVAPAKPSPSSAKKRTAPPPIPMAFLLAADVIRRAGKDLWWRATPDSCGKDDICVGSRQKWEDVLPAFIEADLVNPNPNSCCVPSPSVEESVSYSATRKNGRMCSNISRSIAV